MPGMRKVTLPQGLHRMRGLNGIADSVGMRLDKLREMGKDGEARCAAAHGVTEVEHDSASEQQQQRVCKEG